MKQIDVYKKDWRKKKLYSLRVCPSTKVRVGTLFYHTVTRNRLRYTHHYQIILHDEQNMFTIDNGGGVSVKMVSQSRECIVATYHRFKLDISGSKGLLSIYLIEHDAPFLHFKYQEN